MDNYKIYGLKLKGDNPIQYVGLTRRPLNIRLYDHKRPANQSNIKRHRWIQDNRDEIEIILLEGNIPDFDSACVKEVEYITKYKSLGYDLLNISDGGSACKGPREYKVTEAEKKRRSEYLKKNNPSRILKKYCVVFYY